VTAATQAQVIQQITDRRRDNLRGVAIDDEATVVFTISTSDQFGTNPEHSLQLLKWTFPGPVGTQVGSFADGLLDSTISVTDDGTRVVVVSPSDPVGQNHDGSLEAFLMMADGTGIVQLTNDPGPSAGSVHLAAISGVGNRVICSSDSDPLGSNPARHDQLFLVNTTTLDVTQLTTSTGGEFQDISLTDSGRQAVFGHNGDLTGDNPDGSFEVFFLEVDSLSLIQVTDTGAGRPRIAGSGSTIVFRDGVDLFTVSPGGTPVPLVSGCCATITDDGASVYFVDYPPPQELAELLVVPSVGGAATLLTDPTDNIWNVDPVVSGDNSRLAFIAQGGEYPGGNNPDGARELHVMDTDGGNIEQLSESGGLFGAYLWDTDITEDGSRIVFVISWGLFRMQSDGSDLFYLGSSGIPEDPAITADGKTIVYTADGDPTGENPDHRRQIFQVQDDGTGLLQLTPGGCAAMMPAIAGDGSVVVFQAGCNLTPGGFGELYSVPVGGGTFTQLTDDDGSSFKFPEISGDGTWVAYDTEGDHDGLNPDGSSEVLRARTDGTLVERITNSTYDSWRADISSDGRRVAYASRADPLGTNPDLNAEIFVYDAGTTTTLQLTFTTDGGASGPSISSDGAYVYLLSSASFFESNLDELYDVYRVAVDTGTIERAGGFRDVRSAAYHVDMSLATAGDGSFAVFQGHMNPVDQNPDLTVTDEMWFVDFSTPAKIYPSKETPTVVTWDVEPSPLRYDVIRGDLADLQLGPGGIAVDLGPVICLEDDSPDATTLGFEDLVEPSPGEAFFFLYRGSQGIDDGPGSWGRGTGDAERIAGAGSCLP
jgi:Tol biopolymer transport system component